jgi:hypothetical protein
MTIVLKIRSLIALVAVAAIICPPTLYGGDSGISPSLAVGALSVDQVVDNLVHMNQERAQALLAAEETRVYRLVYRGFPGDRDAQMTVQATYTKPSTKEFTVISQTGSKLILDRVFKKLLESEQEAAKPAMVARTQLNRENYTFVLVDYKPTPAGGYYVLQVNPKSRSKYVFRGKVWVDGKDFAVTQIEAEPAQNPSFWTKKSEIRHDYEKVEDFWLPARNESVSDIRLGGRATLTIEYKNYHVTDARKPNEARSLSPLITGVR